jgi:RHS repeat-associated protein
MIIGMCLQEIGISILQVIKYDGVWSSPVWDSGKTEFTSNVLEGDRTEDISYGGEPLHLDGMKYFWRIKLWDDEDNEGAWTNGKDYFVMAGKRIQDLAYTYDDVGNITQIIDESETNTRKNANFEYDDLYRITSAAITNTANNDDYTQNFTYDSIGNITSFPDNGDYEYNGNSSTSYANPHAVTDLPDLYLDVNYDNNGNLISEIWSPYQWTIFSATWDYNNRMLSTTSLNDPAEYAYDHMGQRIKQDIDTGADVTVYPNKYYNVDTQGETSKVTEHVYDNKGNLLLTAENDGENLTLHYDHTDHLGGSSVMTDTDGVVEQIIDYYPFGSMRFNQKETAFDEQRKFTGHEYDSDSSGLTYFGARYYSGEAGKFITQDPVFIAIGDKNEFKRKAKIELEKYLSNPQIMNSYAYAGNNPLVNKDPDGQLFEYFAIKGAFNLISSRVNASQVSNYIKNDASYNFLQSNQERVDAIYSKSLEVSKGNVGNALLTSTFSTISIKNPGDSLIAGNPLKPSENSIRLQNLPNGLSGDYKNVSGDTDKLQHFFGSSYLTYVLGSKVADFIGKTFETIEPVMSDQSYDSRDIQANGFGQNFGNSVRQDSSSVPSSTLKSINY